MTNSFAQIVLAIPVPGPFDYEVPENLRAEIKIGQRVLVPFRSKSAVGYVVGLSEKSHIAKTKPITAILENFPSLSSSDLKLTLDMAKYYACSWGEAIDLFLPKSLRTRKVMTFVSPSADPRPVEAKTALLAATFQEAQAQVISVLKKFLQNGQGIIVLVPEHEQIKSIQVLLEKELQEPVVILDRGLTPAKELANWLEVKEGKKRVVIGTRSAIFAPVAHLGLIVMVDEENAAYKQEPSPFYHSREVALMRQHHESCDLLFVTPAPTAELWDLVKDKRTLFSQNLTPLQTIDLTNYKPRSQMLISFPLQTLIQEALQKKGKVLLFLNRRGFSTMTRCNQCGHVMKCPRCAVNLTFQYSFKKLICRRCQSKFDLPKICPQCRGAYLRSTGTGSEKMESELTRIYPFHRIALFDRETPKVPKDADIVIATQAIIPILDQTAFSLIAVLDFDSEINRVDFRAGERVFSTLRRLRSAAREKLVVQTRNPDHVAIRAASQADLEKFYQEELKLRREMDLPPYKHLIAVSLRGIKESLVSEYAENLSRDLHRFEKDFTISEPEPDLVPKLRDKYRFTIMLKGLSVKDILTAAEPVIWEFKKNKGTILTINVDP